MEQGIKLRFAKEILDEEWVDFERRHRGVIGARTRRVTGRLRDERRYSTTQQGINPVASFTHPVYERFLDMKKNYLGDIKTKHGTRKDVFYRRKGRAIHNRMIFGKLTPLSYRLLNELSDRVREYFRRAIKN